MIFENSLNMSVVKLFMKNIRRQDFRISLKNLSRISCVVELGIIKNDDQVKVALLLKKAKKKNMDFNFYPPQITIQAGLNMNFTMMVRSLGVQYKKNNRIHLVLTAKIKNTSVIFSYPVLLILPETA